MVRPDGIEPPTTWFEASCTNEQFINEITAELPADTPLAMHRGQVDAGLLDAVTQLVPRPTVRAIPNASITRSATAVTDRDVLSMRKCG